MGVSSVRCGNMAPHLWSSSSIICWRSSSTRVQANIHTWWMTNIAVSPIVKSVHQYALNLQADKKDASGAVCSRMRKLQASAPVNDVFLLFLFV